MILSLQVLFNNGFDGLNRCVFLTSPRVRVAEFQRPLLLVIRLGLEPKTPTLKVLCSTD